VLFHDPTSEPCRAVHWFAVEAGIDLALRYTWLTRGDHKTEEFLEVNPGHQVPTLKHADFCLPEASAIMLYLAEQAGIQDRWIGCTPVERAQSHRFLSWHHTNTRLKLTLDYVLPVLLMPAYKGAVPPTHDEQKRLRSRGRESLVHLQGMLATQGQFLGGEQPSVADFHVASDLFALDADPKRSDWFDGLPVISGWLERLRDREGYQSSHAAWNAVVPRIRDLVMNPTSDARDPGWVADLCLQHVR
jgi:glutathione S-transferase